MDLTDTIVPKSDQINAEDLLAGPQAYTVDKVTAGNSEQPVNVHLVELPGRPYRPSKSMRRVLVAAWGKEASAYAGRRMVLYRDADVTFGGMVVGGIKISHLSHIDKRLAIPLTVKRGRREKHTVEPLADAAPATPELTPDELAAQVASGIKDATTEDEIREWGNRAHARGLLDVQVEGLVLRDHVTHALAALAEAQPAPEAGDQ